MIYFVQPTDGGPVKIGYTEDVPTRVRQLEAHYGRPLAILGTMPGDQEDERAIHDRFAHLRFGKTEQFQPDPELMAFIGRPLFVNQSPAELMESKPAPVVVVRCTAEFKQWLEDFAVASRYKVPQLLELGLVEMAKIHGYPPPPYRRP